MAEYKVPLTKILEVNAHPNADKLEIAKVYDFNVIVGKGQYKVGDLCIYCPIDSILPLDLETKLFGGPDSKIKLNKGRIKQIKIRQIYSQGLLVDLKYLGSPFTTANVDGLLETDFSSVLGITKYEPPAPNYAGPTLKRDKPKENPLFHQYNGIDNFKWFPDLFAEGEQVSITEKIHGSNIRFGLIPYVANNPWRKLLKWLKLTPEFEWCYGSNRVQLQQRKGYKGCMVKMSMVMFLQNIMPKIK
jgi:RNA ligase (TIGR02306 family)